MDTPLDSMSPDAGISTARKIANYGLFALLVVWCIDLLLPVTFLHGATQILLVACQAAIFIPLAAACKAASIGRGDYSTVFMLLSMAVFGLSLWRSRAFSALMTGSRNARLILAALLSFALLLVYDFLFSSAPFYPFGEQAWYFLLLAFVISMALKARPTTWRVLLAVTIGLAVLQCANAVVLFTVGEGIFRSPGIGNRAAGTLSTPNVLYPICMIVVLLMVTTALTERHAWLRRLYWASALAAAAALFLTFSRAGGVGVSAGLLYLAIRERPEYRRKVLVLLGLAVAMTVSMILARAMPEVTGVYGTDRAVLGRVQIWRVSTKVIAHNWLLGVGHGAYQDAQRRQMDSRLDKYNPMNTEAKNQFLTMASEHGVLGVAVLVFVILALSAQRRRENGEDPPVWEEGMSSAVRVVGAGLLAVMLLDTPVYVDEHFPATFIWFCCMGYLLHREIASRPPDPHWRLPRVLRASLLVTGILIASIAAVPLSLGLHDGIRAIRVFDEKMSSLRSAPSFTDGDRIPKALVYCVTANEDKFFADHHGFNLFDMHRALRANMRAGRVKQGGSTISQQLAKNLFFRKDRTFRRKVAELVVTVLIERRLPKEEITEAYLNVIDFGLGACGIRQAARTYFGKDPSQLTSAECALLAGLISNPPRDRLTPAQVEHALSFTLCELVYVSRQTRTSAWLELCDQPVSKWVSGHITSPSYTPVAGRELHVIPSRE